MRLGLKIIGQKVTITGTLPKDFNGYTVFSNHVSMLDIPVIASALKGNIGFMCKDELKKIPLMKTLVRGSGGEFISRTNAREGIKSIKWAAEKVKSGSNIIIFPEGRRDIRDQEYKMGSFKIAEKAKSPILPVTVRNTSASLEQNGGRLKSGESFVTFHEAIKYEDYKDLTNEELTNLVRSIIISV